MAHPQPLLDKARAFLLEKRYASPTNTTTVGLLNTSCYFALPVTCTHISSEEAGSPHIDRKKSVKKNNPSKKKISYEEAVSYMLNLALNPQRVQLC